MPEPCGEVDTVNYSESVAATIVNYYHPAFVVQFGRHNTLRTCTIAGSSPVGSTKCSCGGIGRHAEFRIQYRKVWRFESSLEHL